jgi:hypothetical protein
VIDGIRTRDTRDHNPVLYQLSYDHHADTEVISVAPDNHTDIPRAAGDRVRRGRVIYRSAAMAFAVSTSGPGCGTKIVRR